MKFDSLITFLMPKNDRFFEYFEQTADNLITAVELLRQLPSVSGQDVTDLVKKIEDVEHRGDTITHEIMSELNGTFITPFDREDIHRLASAIDDILDNINGSAVRYSLYKIRECPPDMVRLIGILERSIRELHRGVHLIRDLKKGVQIAEVIEKVNECENEADDAFEAAIAGLFENEKDPIQVIKLKEIYVSLETATDKCEDAANVLEGLMLKHS